MKPMSREGLSSLLDRPSLVVVLTSLFFLQMIPNIGRTQVIFSDNFNLGLNPAWVPSGPCSWQVVSGELRTSNFQCQTLCYMTVGNQSWTDYRLEMDVKGYVGKDKVFSFRNYGINFRSTPLNDIHLTGSGEDLVRSISNVNGASYHFKVECVGNHISLWIDGQQLYDYYDNSSPSLSGGISLNLYSGGVCEADVAFDNVVVTRLHSRPIVLVHGWTSSANVWGTPASPGMKQWLENDGFQYVWPVEIEPCGALSEVAFKTFWGVIKPYYMYRGNAEVLANRIQEKIDALPAEVRSGISTIDIVAHSMGGLVSRRYLSWRSGDPWTPKAVSKLIMLGTPNQGSSWGGKWQAQIPQWKAGGDCRNTISRVAWDELGTKEMLAFNSPKNFPMGKPVGPDYRVIWGNWSWANRGCNLQGLLGLGEEPPNDGIVSRNSAIGKAAVGWNRYVTYYSQNSGVNSCHTALPSNSSVYNLTRNALLGTPFQFEKFAEPQNDSISLQIILDTGGSLPIAGIIHDSLLISPADTLVFQLLMTDSLGSMIVQSPSGQSFGLGSTTPDSSVVYWSDSTGSMMLYIQPAEGGWWKWTIAPSASSADSVWYSFTVAYRGPIEVMASQNVDYLEPGDTLNIQVSATESALPLLGLVVEARPIWNETDTGAVIVLKDDGLSGDESSGDGIYGANTNPLDTGIIDISISVNGNSSQGEVNRKLSILAYSSYTCCLGLTGNVDCDPADGVDISDLTALIDYLYITFSPICCPPEANADGQPGVDISDLTALIDYLYISFTPPAACQ